jgi:hypothetical protein
MHNITPSPSKIIFFPCLISLNTKMHGNGNYAILAPFLIKKYLEDPTMLSYARVTL